jgi:ketosteroid isomerase-like protein
VSTPRETAEAFSGHRFRDAYDALAADVRWTSVGQGVVSGRQAVVEACEATLAELAGTAVEFSRFLVVAADDAAAVDVVGRYVDADGTAVVVSSCDVYEFRDGLVTAITSYAVELG